MKQEHIKVEINDNQTQMEVAAIKEELEKLRQANAKVNHENRDVKA